MISSSSAVRPFHLQYFDQSCLGVGNMGRELAKREGGFLLRAEPGAVVEDEAVAIGRKNKRNIEGYGIVQGLLHAVADAVVVVLGLDDGDRDVGLVIKDVIGALGLPAGYQL